MYVNMETITPENARTLLDRSKDNFNNRPLSWFSPRHSVNKYADDIREGKWDEYNGETIKIDEDGNLIDGYHRLNAIIAAGKPIKMLVVRGIKRDSFTTIDIGKQRTDADMVFAYNICHKNHKAVTSGAKRILTYIHKGRLDGKRYPFHTPENIALCIKNHNLLHKAATVYQKSAHSVIISQGNLLASYCATCEFAPSKGEMFFEGVIDGINLGKDDPRRALRETMRNMRMKSNGNIIDQVQEGALLIKAWNAFYLEKPIKQLRFISTEEYPHFIGWKPEI